MSESRPMKTNKTAKLPSKLFTSLQNPPIQTFAVDEQSYIGSCSTSNTLDTKNTPIDKVILRVQF